MDKKRGDRSKYIIATKVAGPGMEYVRGGSRLSSEHIVKAVESSLKRLQTDYIDLYQVHWPERKSNYFGRLGYEYSEETGVTIEETYKAMDKLVRDGKVRYLGISMKRHGVLMSISGLRESMDTIRLCRYKIHTHC